MNTHLDPLSDRAADWVAQVGSHSSDTVSSGPLALRGHAICEELRRRGDSSDAELIESIESCLGALPATSVPAFVESATGHWNGLMTALDREEANFEHVRRETRDVFFSVLDALIVAEEAGGPEAEHAARQLFNAVVGDLYAFEPMADVAAELRRREHGEFRLSDLLCTGVAGMFDGQVRERTAVRPERVEVDDQVEEFVPLTVWLQRDEKSGCPGQPLTIAVLARRLAEIPAWYVKWSTQQLRLSVNAAARELRVQVIEADGGGGPSLAMEGWQVRVGTGAKDKPVIIKAGAATIPLAEKPEPTKLLLQVRDPAANAEWADVFARVGA